MGRSSQIFSPWGDPAKFSLEWQENTAETPRGEILEVFSNPIPRVKRPWDPSAAWPRIRRDFPREFLSCACPGAVPAAPELLPKNQSGKSPPRPWIWGLRPRDFPGNSPSHRFVFRCRGLFLARESPALPAEPKSTNLGAHSRFLSSVGRCKAALALLWDI